MAIRNRIRELRVVKASELQANPRNWRTHPDDQRAALRDLLAEIGYADALLARETEDGTLELIDGHLRAETTPDQEVPVLVVDVTEQEADKLLLLLDPLAAMAKADQEKLAALKNRADVQGAALRSALDAMLDDATEEAGKQATALRQLSTDRPPAMTWVLVGIPTVRYGEIAAAVESVASVQGVVVEMTVNDG